MQPWHYDPDERLDPALHEWLRDFPRPPGLLLSGVRTLSALLYRGWLHAYHRLTIVGQENLPAHGSFVMVANHASHLDTLCLLTALPAQRRNDAYPTAARDYFFARRGGAWLATACVNALPFDRRCAPWACMSICAHLLRSASSVLIFFPEGTRSTSATDEPGPFKSGVALLTAGRDVPIVPCHLSGTHAALPRGAWYPRPRAVRLTIGTPRTYAHMPATRDAAREICRELREAVIALGRPSVPTSSPNLARVA